MLIGAVVAPFLSPYHRARKLTDTTSITPEKTPKPVSIVIVEHDSAFRLEQILPHYLSQDYEADYQVVVVIDQNDSESEDVLKRNSSNPHLYYTTLPVTSRYVSRKKLGITLGMKAAKYDWVILTDVHCRPTSDKWLTHFTTHCTEDKNMVLGLTPYATETPAMKRCNHLRTMLYYLRMAVDGMAFSTNQSVVALRKSDFFAQKGFDGNLDYTRAEFEFLVNKYATEEGTTIAIEPEARLQQFKPNPKRRLARELFAMDAMKSMQRSWSYKMKKSIDSFAMHLHNIITIISIAIGLLLLLDMVQITLPQVLQPIQEWEGAILITSAAITWIASYATRCIIYNKVLKAFTSISPLMAIMQEWMMPLHNISLKIRYRLSDKNDFITHKL